ncbi:hypothetical protein [Pseudonocardia sp. GCM10023141]|uniref:hypothetical protein n=1 Tax=Pseudonocardia sp. GCM10023141 TaxID=3252653 RepID=UPI0036099F83
MSWIRYVVAALLVVLLAGAGAWMLPPPPADLAQLTGCGWVQTEQVTAGSRTVVEVRVTRCSGAGTLRAPSAATSEHVAGMTWQALRRPVDAVHVRLLDGLPGTPGPVVYDGGALSRLYDLGSAPRPAQAAGNALWFLLPASYLSVFVLMCLLATRIRRAGAVLLFFKTSR